MRRIAHWGCFSVQPKMRSASEDGVTARSWIPGPFGRKSALLCIAALGPHYESGNDEECVVVVVRVVLVPIRSNRDPLATAIDPGLVRLHVVFSVGDGLSVRRSIGQGRPDVLVRIS